MTKVFYYFSSTFSKMHEVMPFSDLEQHLSEELLMRSFDLSYNYGGPDSSVGLAPAYVYSGPEFEPRSRRNRLNRKRGCVAHSFSLSPVHCPDMTEILLKRT